MGQVVGDAYTAGGTQRAFLYSGGVMMDLGALPGKTDSCAYGINNNGQVVGDSYTAGSGNGTAAFLYSSGKMVDLNTLIPSDSGWVLVDAQKINDNGQIVGWGAINGQEHGYLLTPVPEPALLSLLALGGAVMLLRRRTM